MTPEQWEQLSQLRKQLAPICRELTRLSERGDLDRLQTESFCLIKEIQAWYSNVVAITAEYKKVKCSQCGKKPVYTYVLQGKVQGACGEHYGAVQTWAAGLEIDLQFAQVPNAKPEEPKEAKEVPTIIREVHKAMTKRMEDHSKELGERLEAYSKKLTEGTMTVNDIREAEGLPPMEPPTAEVPK